MLRNNKLVRERTDKKVWELKEENRKVRETFTLLEDIKKKVEKELKNSESYKQKIILSKVGIFADCLIKCYSPEKEMFLRFDLLPPLKRKKLVKKMKKYLFGINEFSVKRKYDSTWRKIGKNTVEKNKENLIDLGKYQNI